MSETGTLLSGGVNPPSGSDREGWRRSARWLAFCVVFYAVPVLVLLTALRLEVQRSVRDATDEQYRRLEQRLGRVALFSNPTWYLRTLLQRDLLAAALAPETRAAVLARLRRRLPPGARILALDGQGMPIASMSDLRVSDADARCIWEGARMTVDDRHEGLTARGYRMAPVLRSIRNSLNTPLLPSLGIDNFREASADPERALLYCERPTRQGMTVLLLPDLRGCPDIGLRDQIARHSRLSVDVRLVLIDLQTWQAVGEVPPPAAAALPRALAALGQGRDARVQVGDWLWAGTPIGENRQLLCVGPAPAGVDGDLRWRAGLVGAVLFVSLAAGITWMLWDARRRWHLSLRQRLLLLFFYAAGLPLCLLFVAGRQHVATRAAAVEHAQIERLRMVLRSVDSGFRRFLGQREATLLRRLRALRPGQDVVHTVTPRLQWLVERRSAVVELVDDRGRGAGLNPPTMNRLVRLFRTPALHAMADTNPEVAQRLHAADATLAEQLLTENPVFQAFDTALCATVNRFVAVDISGVGLVFTCSIPDLSGVARHAVIVYWPAAWMAEQYLRRTLPLIEARVPGLRLSARMAADETWNINQAGARKTGWALPLAILNRRLDTPGEIVQLWIPMRSGRQLVLAMQGVSMDRHQVVARVDDRTIIAAVHDQTRELFWLGILILLAVMGPGLLVVPVLLAPIPHLQAGIAAMAERRFKTQIPVVGGDEFGALAQAFNTMLAGLADLDLAGAIQHGLMPRAPGGNGVVRIYGRCMSATEVGGDYVDYVRLDDDSWLVVVGDVSGHGAAAGMVMAMARAVVVHADTPRHDPAVLLATLNSVLLRAVGGRRMMTFCAGVIDAAGTRVRLANAGHWPPLLLRNGAVTELSMHGIPLGLDVRRSWQMREFELRAGDRLLFFSDGLTETPLVGTTTAIGDDRLRADLPALLAPDPVVAEANVRSWFQRLAGDGLPPDDVTVAVVAIGDRVP